jgi:integrase
MRRRLPRGTTYEEAKGIASSFREKILRDEYDQAEMRVSPTLKDFLPKFRQWYKTQHPRSYQNDELDLRHLFSFFDENGRLNKIERADITAYKEYRQKAGASSRKINMELATLKRLYRLAYEYGKVSFRIYYDVKDTRLMREKRKAVYYLEPEDIKKMILAANPTYQFMIVFLLYTGLRLGEFLRLKRNDVNINRRFITVLDSKREKEDRQVPFAEELVSVYLRWCSAVDSDWIFCKEDGMPYARTSSVQHTMIRLVRRAGITKPCSANILRHTYISNKLLAGTSSAIVAQIAGTSVETIEKHYFHMSQAAREIANTNVVNYVAFLKE